MSKLGIIKTENLSKLGEYLDTNTTGAKVSEIALALIALTIASGIVVLAAGIGNAIQLFDSRKFGKKFSKEQRTSAFENLYRQKSIINKNGKIHITTKGNRTLLNFELRQLRIKRPATWDNYWRIVIFDIPSSNRKARDAFRFCLKRLGFLQFQKSVWINPFPCLEEIDFISEHFKVSEYVELLLVKSITHESKFKKHFHL
jgi:hypothetical protein